MSTAVQRGPKKFWRSNSIFNLWRYLKLCQNQCFGFGFIKFGSGFRSSILAEYRSGFRVLMTKTWKKLQLKKKIIFFSDQKLQYTYPWASIKDVKATGEAFSPQRRTTLQTMKFLNFFLFLWVTVALLDPDPLTWMDPDPKTLAKTTGNPQLVNLDLGFFNDTSIQTFQVSKLMHDFISFKYCRLLRFLLLRVMHLFFLTLTKQNTDLCG